MRSSMHLPRFLPSALLAGFALTAQASPTKPFTGVAILLLQDEGKLNFDDEPIRAFLQAAVGP